VPTQLVLHSCGRPHARCHLDALRARLGRARESAYSSGPCREWGRKISCWSMAARPSLMEPPIKLASRRSMSGGVRMRRGTIRCEKRGASCSIRSYPIGECEISACVAEHPLRYMGVRPQGLTLSGTSSTSLRTGPRLIWSGSGRSWSPNVTRPVRGKDRVNERADVGAPDGYDAAVSRGDNGKADIRPVCRQRSLLPGHT
jgi:hypothetical protein